MPEYVTIDWREYTRLVNERARLSIELQRVGERIAAIEADIKHNQQLAVTQR